MLAQSPTAAEQVRDSACDGACDVRAPLRDVLDALCQGIARGSGTGNVGEADRFVALAEAAKKSMAERVPAPLQRVSFLGATFRDMALSAARAGKHTAADDAVRRARNAVAAFPDPEITRFADTLTEAAAAYVDYKAGRFQEARTGIEASLYATNRLLMDYRCEAMQLRRVHLAANLVRMGARSGDGVGAMEIASGLLSYLEGNDASWPLPGFEVEWPIGAIPLDDRVTMSGQIGGEIAMVISAPKSNPAALLMYVESHAGSNATGACAPFQSLHKWLRLRWAHCNDGPQGFLNAARDFFATQQPGAFWSDAARLLDRFCVPLALDEATNVRQTLAMSVGKTPDLSAIRF